jgi:hypothetical protein
MTFYRNAFLRGYFSDEIRVSLMQLSASLKALACFVLVETE